MKLSIITINLNNVSGLKKTIDSVVSQSFGDFEWIVIDGGSTDGSKELIEEYSSHFAFWISEPDSGIYNAMNKGVTHANGEYCQFLNSGDCFYDSNSLELVFINSVCGDIIYGDMQVERDGGLERIIRYEDNLSFVNLVNRSISHPSSFIRRELLQASPYNEDMKIVSDWEFFIKMALADKTFVHIPVVVTRFDLSGISAIDAELNEKERKAVTSSLLPRTISNSCVEALAISRKLDEGGNRKMMEMRNRHKLFSKFITLEVLIMEKIEKLF